MTTPVEIISLIRASNRGVPSLDLAECVSLIENYSACVAAEASVKATTETYNRALAAFDAVATV